MSSVHLKPGFVVPGSHEAYLSQNDPNEHIRFYRHFHDVARHLYLGDDPMLPALCYWDFRAPNIFVRDGRISTIIDWQGVQVLPLGLNAAPPRLIDFKGELQFELSDDFDTIENEDERARKKHQVESSILLQRYFDATQDRNRTFDEVYDHPIAPTIRNLAAYSDNSWGGGMASLRQCLMTIQNSWSQIAGDGIACPIDFNRDDINRYINESLGYQENRAFWDELKGYVTEDSSVSHEDHDAALDLFRDYREKYLKGLSGEQKDAFAQQTAWAAQSW